ncbi:hypothetical protein Tco_0707374 [Tanacetum coccineum]|uniref:Uncharacterized protein n=1 Tax=Tanacetum coccineum TaxID=301880 RepID=A0ABQ4YA45_9ASTR
MSSSNHPIIVPSESDIEDAFSSTNVPDYFPATPGNTSPDSSNDLTKYLLATLVFSPLDDDLYMEIMQAYDATDNELHFFPLEEISPPKYIETLVESPIPISPSLSVGSSSPVRSTTPPPDYSFDKSIFAKLDNSLWIIPRPPGSEPEDASKQGRKIDDIDKDAEITLVDETQGRYGDEEMFDTGVLDGDEVLAEPKVIVKDVNLSVDEVTLAQALAALKSAKVQDKRPML